MPDPVVPKSRSRRTNPAVPPAPAQPALAPPRYECADRTPEARALRRARLVGLIARLIADDLVRDARGVHL